VYCGGIDLYGGGIGYNDLLQVDKRVRRISAISSVSRKKIRKEERDRREVPLAHKRSRNLGTHSSAWKSMVGVS